MKCYRELLRKNKQIKTMTNKIAKDINYQQMNLKKQSKQTRRPETEPWVRRVFGCQMGRWCEGMGMRSGYRCYSHGDVKYSIGNGVAEELICMTHGPRT